MPERARTVITLGVFDGVHVGHAALAARARALAGPQGRVLALVFDPHPLETLRPALAPPRLSTFEQRRAWMLELGADEVHRLEPSTELLALEPEAFLRRVAREHAPDVIVEGPDFRFGRARAGDARTISKVGAELGFSADTTPNVEVTLTNQLIKTASSSLVRRLIVDGRVSDAAIVLGRPYEMVGDVIRGDRKGRELGFPTANLESPCLCPRDGVYAGWATLEDGRRLIAAISVGTKPAFGGRPRAIEAHVLDWEGPVPEGAPEYGWALRLQFTRWLRDQAPFPTIDALVRQIRVDVERCRERVAACAGSSA